MRYIFGILIILLLLSGIGIISASSEKFEVNVKVVDDSDVNTSITTRAIGFNSVKGSLNKSLGGFLKDSSSVFLIFFGIVILIIIFIIIRFRLRRK